MTIEGVPDGDGVCLCGGFQSIKARLTEVDRLGGEGTMWPAGKGNYETTYIS